MESTVHSEKVICDHHDFSHGNRNCLYTLNARVFLCIYDIMYLALHLFSIHYFDIWHVALTIMYPTILAYWYFGLTLFDNLVARDHSYCT